jgi:hypothetical protein
MQSSICIQFPKRSSKRVAYNLPDFRKDSGKEVHLLALRHLIIDVFLKVVVGHFVPGLELAVVVCVFLYGIVSQMHEFVADLPNVVFLTGSPKVPVFIEPAKANTVVAGIKGITPDIKFSLVD